MYRFATLLFVLTSWSAHGQFSMEDFLASSSNSAEALALKKQLDYVRETEFNSPFLREVEVRLRETIVSEGLEDYRLRFSPVNPLERRANRNYRTAINRQMEVEYELTLNEVLYSKYKILVGHYSTTREIETLEKNIALLEEIVSLAGRQPERFNAEDLVELDRDLFDSRLKLQDRQAVQQRLEFLIRLTYPFEGGITWENLDLVDVERIRNWINTGQTPLENNLIMTRMKERTNVEKSIFEINRRESFSNLGYLQAEYNTDNERTFDQNLGIQLGLTLPIVNPDRPDLQRRMIDVVEAEGRIEEQREELNTEYGLLFLEMEHVLTKYDMVSEKLKNYLSVPLATQLERNGLGLVRELREYKIELEDLAEKLYSELMGHYIEALALEGALVKGPLVNYLSYSGSTFELGGQ